MEQETTKLLKVFLADAYQKEEHFIQLIEDCFKEIFKEQSSYFVSVFKEDLEIRTHIEQFGYFIFDLSKLNPKFVKN